MRTWKRRLLQQVEVEKNYMRDVIVAFQEGAGHPDAPFTADLAIAALWRRQDRLLDDLGARAGSAWMRVSTKNHALLEGFSLPVVSIACAGARSENNEDVFYVTVSARTVEQVLSEISRLTQHEATVRDWVFTAP